MKRFVSLLLTVALALSLLVVPTMAAAGGRYELVVTKRANGAQIYDLSALAAGTVVDVELTLTRTDIAEGGYYNTWGLELDLNNLGMDYVPDSAQGFSYTLDGNTHNATVGAYYVGGATGTGNIRYFFINTPNMGSRIQVTRSVTVKAQYKVTNPEKAQAWASTPIIYVGEDKETNIVSRDYVTFDANGGTLTSDPSGLYTVGQEIQLPVATRSGYAFLGWTDGTSTFNGTYTVPGGKTLKAVWGGSVAFDLAGGAISGTDPSGSYPLGAQVTLPSAVRAGYTFKGWSLGGSLYQPGNQYTVTGSVIFTANWTAAGSATTYTYSVWKEKYTITASMLDPSLKGTATAEKQADGSVLVTVLDANGKVMETVPGGVRLVIDGLEDGHVAGIFDLETGRLLDLLEKSLVEEHKAYVLVDQGKLLVRIFYNPKPFKDVLTTDWFYKSVVFASSHELFNGVEEGVFGPEIPMNRGMLVTVLYRLENKPAAGPKQLFPDVSSVMYYDVPVRWASTNGLVLGYDDGTFQPERNITREEMAVILYRYMTWLGYDTSQQGNVGGFADADKIDPWALEAMRWAVANGIFQGREDNTIDPRGLAKRSEVATLLMRIVTKMVKP